jgi:hypothetical protein
MKYIYKIRIQGFLNTKWRILNSRQSRLVTFVEICRPTVATRLQGIVLAKAAYVQVRHGIQ